MLNKNTQPSIVSIGLDNFLPTFSANNIAHQHLDWSPPAKGHADLIDALFELSLLPKEENGKNAIENATEEAATRIATGQPILVGVKQAHEVLERMSKNTILHAGPPIAWKDMCGPMRGAFLGAIVYEGLAQDFGQAEKMMDNGEIDYAPNHTRNAVGPMTGMISYSMPLFIVKNETFGNLAYCTINEGLGKVMRFGANGPDVIQRLKWLEKTLAPVLDQVIEEVGGVNLRNVMAKALSMGDEMHQRNVAASLAFYKEIAAALYKVLLGHPEAADIQDFIVSKNEQFFLNLAMAAAKSMTDPAKNIPNSLVITAMSRNGVDFGIQISALGDQWFTAPCDMPEGLYFPGFSEADANPDMGDSAIVECIGIGGMAMGCAPAVVTFVGAESVSMAQDYTRRMGLITAVNNPSLPMPAMDFVGVPTGIDLLKVVSSGILPVINTGIAHKEPGIGQVGAGIVSPPYQIFADGLRAFVAKRSN